jgi:hypothetical protein
MIYIKTFEEKISNNVYKVYHGTNNDFKTFDIKKSTQGIIWFTDDINTIINNEHGGMGNKYILTRYITINNPAGWDEYNKYYLGQIKQMGYDGIILPQGDYSDYIVFSNKQIKINPPKLNKTFELFENTYTLYHGTSSNNLDKIKSKPTKIFLTTDEDVATYYAAKGGELYFLKKEQEFEKQYDQTPDEYFDTEENGEVSMFKALYPKNASPIVIKFEIPKDLISNINDFIGYKGKEFIVNPKYITEIINIDWDDLEY